MQNAIKFVHHNIPLFTIFYNLFYGMKCPVKETNNLDLIVLYPNKYGT